VHEILMGKCRKCAVYYTKKGAEAPLKVTLNETF
jgi:hypothetical protein